MVRVISESDTDVAVITLAKWSVFYTESIAPELMEHFVRMERIASGKYRMIARQDLMIVVEGLWIESCTGADRIVFVRADRSKEGAGSVWFAKPCHWPEVRNALLAANVSPVRSASGFDQVPIYNDEIVVLESPHGTYGWIVKRDAVRTYLRSKPQKNGSGRLGRIKIWHEIYDGPEGKQFAIVRIEGWGKPQTFDTPARSVSEYSVLFDEESRVVQRISLTNKYVEDRSCDRAPIRSIAIGRKLPKNLAWR